MRKGFVTLALAAVAAAIVGAQQPPSRPASPAGSAAAQVGGKYEKNAQGRERYTGGKWIEVTYGRPLKRERNLWGSGAEYAKQYILQNNAPVWRAGANVTTRLKTEAPLQIGGKTGSIDNASHDVRYDWFVGFARERAGKKQVVVAVMVGHQKYIGTRATEYALMALSQYFANPAGRNALSTASRTGTALPST